MTVASRLAALGLIIAIPAAVVSPFFQSQILSLVIGFASLVLFGLGVLIISLKLGRFLIFLLLIGSQAALVVTVVLTVFQVFQAIPQLLPELDVGTIGGPRIGVTTVQYGGATDDEDPLDETQDDEWHQGDETEFEYDKDSPHWSSEQEQSEPEVGNPLSEGGEPLPYPGEEIEEPTEWDFDGETENGASLGFGDGELDNFEQRAEASILLELFSAIARIIGKFAVPLYVVGALASFSQGFGYRQLGNATRVHLFRVAGELHLLLGILLAIETVMVLAFLGGVSTSLDLVMIFVFLTLLQAFVTFLAFSLSLVGFFFIRG